MLHWFTGTKAEAKRAVELGCYFSINIEMLKNERHTALIMGLPQDRLLTETDGPFVKGAGGTMRPRDVTLTLDLLRGSLATKQTISRPRSRVTSNNSCQREERFSHEALPLQHTSTRLISFLSKPYQS